MVARRAHNPKVAGSNPAPATNLQKLIIKPMGKIGILLADGFEEIEAVAVIDILRRANLDVLIVGLSKEPVSSARNVKIVPDVSIDDVDPSTLDLVVLPGGLGGVENLKKDPRVERLIKGVAEKGKFIGAICAAPTALAKFGILEGKKATVYPSLKDDIKNAIYVDNRVVEDSNIITSQGPGTAFDFGLKLVEKLLGREKAKEVAEKMLINY